MLISSFWPPRRARDRWAAERYQRRNPGVPWLSRDAIEILSELLRPTDRCLEWGAGNSTAWIGKRVASIVSVEHDPEWFERVRRTLQHEGLDPGSVRLLSTDSTDGPSRTPYVRAIDAFADRELDACFVDGELRSACTLAAIPKLASGGLLVIDDAHGLLDHPTRSPHSRYGRGPLDRDWAAIAEQLSAWRLIWASDGYSDAGIWFKP